MIQKLMQLIGISVILIVLFIPLCVAVDEVNKSTDMNYAEYTIDE